MKLPLLESSFISYSCTLEDMIIFPDDPTTTLIPKSGVRDLQPPELKPTYEPKVLDKSYNVSGLEISDFLYITQMGSKPSGASSVLRAPGPAPERAPSYTIGASLCANPANPIYASAERWSKLTI